MGAIYWQLNDIWQGASWSSLEYGGRWKVLHYYSKRFFAPTLVSSYIMSGVLHTYVVSDLMVIISSTDLSSKISWQM